MSYNNHLLNSIDHKNTTAWTPITPVPTEAVSSLEQVAYHNQVYGTQPSTMYSYHNAVGEITGCIVRWDTANGKKIHPYQYCLSSNGVKGWRSQGFLEPHPLYNLHHITGRFDTPILVCEGEKTADAAESLFPSYVTTTSMHGAQSTHQSDWSCMEGRDVVIAIDNDEAGKRYGDDVYHLCMSAGAASVKLLDPSIFARYGIDNGSVVDHVRELPRGYDLADLVGEGWTAEYITQLENKLGEIDEVLCVEYTIGLKEVSSENISNQKLRVVTLGEFLAATLPPREDILTPWLQTQSLCMVHAIRGVGKTHFALGVAWAVASGSGFLGWRAPSTVDVLYIDGEMPANVLQERLAKICLENTAPYADNLRILTPDMQENGMPNLATEEGQGLINELLTPHTKLIIVDNLSCLTRGIRENEGHSWDSIGEWALQMRQKGISVLFIHHSGKSGAQRGTSRKEDILDVVINLKHPTDYSPDQGACFEVHFEKARHLVGNDVKPFTAQLIYSHEKQSWKIESVEESNRARVIELCKEGLSNSKIAEELGIDRSTVFRHRQDAEKKGELTPSANLKKGHLK